MEAAKDPANKSEAERCLRIAATARKEGELKKARRFADKSLRLYSTQQAQDFLNELENCDGLGEREEKEKEGGGEGVRRRRRESGEREDRAGADEQEADYTPEQKEAVDRVLRCKDYYDILGVSRSASEAELKKQYRKLALQLHPDKNRAPRADDAFKAVSNAYGVLNDKDKRSRYDRFGEEGIRGSGISSHRHYYADTDAERLFRTVFGDDFSFDAFDSMFTPNHHTTRHYHYRFHNQPRREPVSWWVQMMPILFLLSMLLFMFSMFQSPAFLLYRTSTHHILRHTEKHKIPYYVTDSFKKDYPNLNSIRRLERDVISLKQAELHEQCYYESRGKRRLKGAAKSEPASCTEWRELRKG